MESGKRSMYRAVKKEEPVGKLRRKPLAQGNLLQTPSKESTRTKSAVEEVSATPRRETPQQSFSSPRRAVPTDSLDVSDTESEPQNTFTVGVRPDHRSDGTVLLVEASDSTGDDTFAVPIQSRHVTEPVKVVCHSPRTTPEHRGIMAPEKITVDPVPTVVIQSPSIRGMSRQHTVGTPGASQPSTGLSGPSEVGLLGQEVSGSGEGRLLELVTAAAGDSADFNDLSTMSQVSGCSSISETSRVKKKKTTRIVASRFMQSADKYTDSSRSKSDTTKHVFKRPDSKKKAVKSKEKELKSKDVKSRIPSIKSRSNSREVPRDSRESSRDPPTARTQRDNSAGRPQSARERSAGRAPRFSPALRRPVSARGPQRQEPLGKDASEEKRTSTPTKGLDTQHTELDVSEILAGSMLHGRHDDTVESIKATGRVSRLQLPGRSTASSLAGAPRGRTDASRAKAAAATTQPAKKNVGAQRGVTRSAAEQQKLELDLLYSRYLQWAYLDYSAKHTFKQHERQFINSMNALREECEVLHERELELKSQLEQIRHAKSLDAQLKLQKENLAPVISELSRFVSDQDELSAALDSTRHQLPTSDIYVPADSQQYHEALNSELAETERLLQAICHVTGDSAVDVNRCSEAMKQLQHTTEDQTDQLVRCKEILEAAKSLCIEESSLKIMDHQLKRV